MCAPQILQVAALALGASQSMSAQSQASKAAKQQKEALDALKATSVPKPPTPRRSNDLTGGYSSTLLTGPQGVAPGSQNIGSNTLLGG